MVPKHFHKIFFIYILSSLVPLAHGDSKDGTEEKDKIKWLETRINQVLKDHAPKHNASKLCAFSIVPTATAKAAGETAINYTTLFLSEVARVGPAEVAKRIRHFGRAFPEKLRNSTELANRYSATSGIMAREARWERNVYCADWMAHMLQKLAYVNLTTSVVLVSSVVYQPFKVAVKEKVVPLTIEVNDIKENLTDFVTTVDKNNTRTMNESDNAKIVKWRGKLGEKMDEIAKEESIGNSSSMDFFVNMNYGDVDRGQITTKPVILKISSVGKKTPMPEDDEKKGTNATKPSTKKANADNGKKGNNAAKPPTKKPK